MHGLARRRAEIARGRMHRDEIGERGIDRVARGGRRLAGPARPGRSTESGEGEAHDDLLTVVRTVAGNRRHMAEISRCGAASTPQCDNIHELRPRASAESRIPAALSLAASYFAAVKQTSGAGLVRATPRLRARYGFGCFCASVVQNDDAWRRRNARLQSRDRHRGDSRRAPSQGRIRRQESGGAPARRRTLRLPQQMHASRRPALRGPADFRRVGRQGAVPLASGLLRSRNGRGRRRAGFRAAGALWRRDRGRQGAASKAAGGAAAKEARPGAARILPDRRQRRRRFRGGRHALPRGRRSWHYAHLAGSSAAL